MCEPSSSRSSLRSSSSRIRCALRRRPAERRRGAIVEPHRAAAVLEAVEDGARHVVEIADERGPPEQARRLAMRDEVVAHPRARRQRQRHVAQRLRLERPRLARALQRLVDGAHAPAVAEEGQRLADVAQRARLGHLLVARLRRVEMVIERQRLRQRLSARRPRAARQLVEQPLPAEVGGGLLRNHAGDNLDQKEAQRPFFFLPAGGCFLAGTLARARPSLACTSAGLTSRTR